MIGLSQWLAIPTYTRPSCTTGESYPICSWLAREARTGDCQTRSPVCALTAHRRPSPPFELGSGAPKITTLTRFVKNQNHGMRTVPMVADDAIPGLDGLHWLVETRGALFARGYFHTIVPAKSIAYIRPLRWPT